MCEVKKSFICRGCLNPVTSTGRTSIDIGTSSNLELMDKFCCLGDMFSMTGDADTAVASELDRINSGSWCYYFLASGLRFY